MKNKPPSARSAIEVLPSPAVMEVVELQVQEVTLFNRWTLEDIQINDISLSDYLVVSSTKHAIFLPHSAGRYSEKKFHKATQRVYCCFRKSFWAIVLGAVLWIGGVSGVSSLNFGMGAGILSA